MTDIADSTLAAALCDAAEASGGVLRWAQAARQFDSLEGLDLFRRDLSRRGLLSSAALEAVRERHGQLERGKR